MLGVRFCIIMLVFLMMRCFSSLVVLGCLMLSVRFFLEWLV